MHDLHAFVTALDRCTVQVFNGSTPRSMDAQLSIALQFKSSMDQRQGQWTHSSRSTVQQRQGGTQISRNGRKISIPDNNRHEQETFRSQVHTLDFDWTARQLCMSCTWFFDEIDVVHVIKLCCVHSNLWTATSAWTARDSWHS